MGGESRRTALVLASILVVTLLVYTPCFRAELTNWDDPAYVTDNPLVEDLAPGTVWRVFTETHYAAYAPLTLLSFAVERAVAGDAPWLHHATNVALHLGTTALLFWWVLLLDGRRTVAAATAWMFGLHTLHVESVAWVSERRDVLYGLLFVAALVAYQRYLSHRRPGSYLAALALFVLSATAKGMAAALAPTLVLVDLVAGRRLRDPRVIVEKVPFFVLAALVGAVAVWAEHAEGAVEGSAGARLYDLGERLTLACWSLGHYLAKLALPVHLSAFYPYPEPAGGGLPAHYLLSVLIPVALAALVILLARRLPLAAFGLAFFLVNLALVLQVLPYGDFLVADRYAYVASIGVFLSVAVLAVRAVERAPGSRRPMVACGCAWLALLAVLTFTRCRVWHDSLSLWDDVIARQPRVWLAWDNRGSARAGRGDLAGAIADHTRAIELEPRAAGAWYNRGNARFRAGDVPGAVGDYDAALLLQPGMAAARRNRALAAALLGRAGDPSRAGTPREPPAAGEELLRRAAAEFDAGDRRRALELLDAAVGTGSGGGAARLYRGLARSHVGDLPGALEDLDRVVADAPHLAPAWAYRAAVRVAMGDNAGAKSDCDRALERDPALVDALITRGAALHNLGQLEASIRDLDRALELDPGNPKALLNRGLARIRTGRVAEGCDDLGVARSRGSSEAGAALARWCGR